MSVVDTQEIRAAVAEYIVENFLYARPDYQLGADDPLLDDGILDSMGAVELVAFLQARFGIVIPDDEITEENFRCIRAIADFVGQKRLSAA